MKEFNLKDGVSDEEKQILIKISQGLFGACSFFTDRIERLSNFGELKVLLMQNGDNIAARLGVDTEEDIKELEDEVERLENKADNLQESLDYELSKIKTLNDQIKYDLFMEYAPLFSPNQFETILTTNL